MKASRATNIALYGILVVAWGLNYVFVRAGLEHSPPLWLATERAGFGFLGCLVILTAFRHRWSLPRRDVRTALLVGLPNTTLFFGLWFVAAVTVPPGQVAVIIYTFPLWVALLSGPVLGQRLGPWQWAAILGGFTGVILVAQPWVAGSGSLSPVNAVELIAAAIAWAAATVWYKRRFPSGENAVEANTYQLLGGTLGLLGASLVLEPSGPVAFTPQFVAIVFWLGFVGTAVAYLIWFTLLSRYPAATLTSYTFLVPVVALAASVLVTGETLTTVQVAGVGLILLSIYGVARGSRPAASGETSAAARGAESAPSEPKGQ